MKNIAKKNTILLALLLVFVFAGVLLMSAQISRRNMYTGELEQAVNAADNPDNSALMAAEEEIAQIIAENEKNNEQILALQDEIAAKNKELDKLQQEYDELAAKTDADYYNSILDSLSKGVSLVESYINGEK